MSDYQPLPPKTLQDSPNRLEMLPIINYNTEIILQEYINFINLSALIKLSVEVSCFIWHTRGASS